MRRIEMAVKAVFIVASFVALSMPSIAEAVVQNVTLTGLPPKTSVTLRNKKTNEEVKRETDDRGAVVIPLTGRNWDRGSHYSVTATNSAMFQGSRTKDNVDLNDGNNTVSLAGLVMFYSGDTRGMRQHLIHFDVGWHFFSIEPMGPSIGLTAAYSPPFVMAEDVFNVRPYVSGWVIPSVHINSHKPFDFNGIVQKKIDSGSVYGFNAGLKHTSDMANWGLKIDDGKIIGALSAEMGVVRYDFDLKKLKNPEPEFKNANKFDRSASGFRLGFNAGLGINKDNWFLGVKGGVAPTFIDILNGGCRTVWEGNVGVLGGWMF